MGYSTLELTFDRGIAHLQLTRPQSYNSMNRAFWREWPEILEEIRKADDIRVVVISSTGKHFSAGLDLEIFSNPDPRLFSGEPARRGEFMRRLVLELQDYFTQLEQLRMPVLAAIHGGCIGGALDLVCACDIRYCTEDAFFTLKETAVGMTADLGTLQRLPTIINPGLVREMAYTSRKVEADEAQSSGLVNQLFADSESMLEGVMEIASRIAANSPLAVMGSKVMLNYARDHSVADSLEYMATWQAGMFQQADLVEGFAARIQKRETAYESLRPIEPPMPED
ncbi:MAG: crotonase/enoyl-CoA hydratase family protein [Gammaproteobacteria bacterium]|nr:crotonase/enoyl-CoA hydratase family protein [Gammaproteobacteria bacterium]